MKYLLNSTIIPLEFMNKLSYAIDGLFPTPIYRSYLDRDFSKKELKLIDNQSNALEKNTGNLLSQDKYLFKRPEFKKLKKELMQHVEKYSKVILGLKDSELYITQAWLNFTSENQFHHIHAHPNSLVAGILYINADVEKDNITFFQGGYTRIKPSVKEYHLFNSTSWNYPVKTKDILMFPSELSHKVKNKKGPNKRISLAFNCFIKGQLGHTNHVNELLL